MNTRLSLNDRMGLSLGFCFLFCCTQAWGASPATRSESPVVRGAEKAVAVAVDVTGAEELKLTATIGPDTWDFDQAIWCNPVFVLKDGTRLDATTRPFIRAKSQWKPPEANIVSWQGAKQAKVGGETFSRFFAAHAPSEILLAVPKDAVRFEVRGGLTAPQGKGSSTFRLEAGEFSRRERMEQLCAAATNKLAAIERLYTYRRNANPEFARELDLVNTQLETVRKAVAAIKDPKSSATLFATAEAALQNLEQIKRTLLLELNPSLTNDKILFIRRKNGRNHRPANWQSNSMLPRDGHDNELCTLTVRGANAGATEVVYKPAGGTPIIDVDLHWNADKLLFSGIGTKHAWHVMELDLASRKVRQVTRDNDADINHYDACYVPDGHIIFTCTALKYAVPCVWGDSPVANLFRCNADGSGMELLANDQEHAWCPQVMPDGRVLYLRWEYTDIPHANSRILFTCNPDGTNQRAFYGSNSFWPGSMFYARPIPGKPTQFISVLTGHHGLRREGQLGIFDVNLGTEEADGAIQLIPGYGKKVEPIVRDQLYNHTWPMNLHPFPLDDTTFLVARRNQGESNFGIYLVDRFDNEICLLREAGHDLCEPVPLQKSPVPHAQPDRIDPGNKNAQVYIADIYEGPGLKNIPKGTVKNLRLYTYTFGFLHEGGLYGTIGLDGPWDMRRTLGSVPVNPDGSCYFQVPANTPIAVQPLDAEGKSLQVMRSWFTARSGEYLSCAGCHEKQSFVARAPRVAANMPLEKIRPWYGPERNYEFAREVQPVLDAYCVRCHNEPDPPHAQMFGDKKWKPDLRGNVMLKGWNTRMHGHIWGKWGGKWSVSYFNLVRYVRHPGIESDIHLFEPMEWHADTTELMLLINKGHHGVVLPPEAYDRLVTWIDFNAPYHGRWQTIVDKKDAVDREALREKRRELYTGVKANHETIEVPAPKFETTPLAPAPKAGAPLTVAGWPFDAKAKPSAPAGALQLAKGVEIPLVAIPGGSFVMGTNAAKGPRDEHPAAVVAVKPFKMGVREVTNREFREFDPKHSSRAESRHGYQFGVTGYDVNGDDLPAVRVNWQQANAFCAWLSKKTGRKVRLPTEAEWEWAARAGSAQPFWWGDCSVNFAKYANLADISLSDYSGNPYVQDREKARYGNPENLFDNWVPQAHGVNDGSFLQAASGKWQANPWGLRDMHGNVWEWTLSKARPYPYVADDGRNAVDATDERRIVRGGSWYSRPKLATASFRRAYRPYAPVFDVGFRVVVED